MMLVGKTGPCQGCAGGCQAQGWQPVKWHPGAGGMGCWRVWEEDPNSNPELCLAPPAPHPQHSSTQGQPAHSLAPDGTARAGNTRDGKTSKRMKPKCRYVRLGEEQEGERGRWGCSQPGSNTAGLISEGVGRELTAGAPSFAPCTPKGVFGQDSAPTAAMRSSSQGGREGRRSSRD